MTRRNQNHNEGVANPIAGVEYKYKSHLSYNSADDQRPRVYVKISRSKKSVIALIDTGSTDSIVPRLVYEILPDDLKSVVQGEVDYHTIGSKAPHRLQRLAKSLSFTVKSQGGKDKASYRLEFLVGPSDPDSSAFGHEVILGMDFLKSAQRLGFDMTDAGFGHLYHRLPRKTEEFEPVPPTDIPNLPEVAPPPPSPPASTPYWLSSTLRFLSWTSKTIFVKWASALGREVIRVILGG